MLVRHFSVGYPTTCMSVDGSVVVPKSADSWLSSSFAHLGLL